MWMSDGEIRVFYRQAKSPEKEIKILAELNACPVNKIKKIIFKEKEVQNERKN